MSIKFASAFHLDSHKWTGGQDLSLLLFLPLPVGPEEGEEARDLTVKGGSQLWCQDKAAAKAGNRHLSINEGRLVWGLLDVGLLLPAMETA